MKIKTVAMADLKQPVYLKYVKLGYRYLAAHGMYLLLIPLASAAASCLTAQDLQGLQEQLRGNVVLALLCSSILSFLSSLYVLSRPCPVYLVDFSCCKPDDGYKSTQQKLLELSRLTGAFTEESLEFQRKVMERSGLGESSYVPGSLLSVPVDTSVAEARKETKTVAVAVLDELFAKTGIKPRDVGILIVNCGMFCPTPSLSSMIVNHYKLKENILSYNLGGMGCSASVLAVDLARKLLLRSHSNTYAVVFSTENITMNLYSGNDRSMLVTNCLFRMGGAAILLSNRRSDRRRSKYQLVHTVRTHRGGEDRSYGCILQREDDEGKVGISLSKDLPVVAGEALKANITALAPLVLPMSEKLLFLATLVGRKLFKKKVKPYVPDFKQAFQHFCFHPGGRAVLDEMEKNLQLSEWHLEPSRMTLYKFGNTSSSSIWYELAYTEGKGRIRKGDMVWQMALGSGFKCGSAVWKALRTVKPAKEKNPWMDEIDKFPVTIPKVSAI
ncbi:hypothetical protein Taro_028766 [Colocasia esculenta]|uniref:3-ketoacyl-CoA synthase n=1 Tax=Colocasia esculenta TaxID=4460 RepID=A0A843VC60_COLES|nr:hypothetical protein [Colocasia esculenta]